MNNMNTGHLADKGAIETRLRRPAYGAIMLLAATALVFTGCRGFPKYVELDSGELVADSKVGQSSTPEKHHAGFSSVHPNPSNR